MSNNTTTNNNPFSFEAEQDSSKTRKLAYTDTLINTASSKAHNLMTEGCSTDELKALANKMLEGNPSDLVSLIQAVYGDEQIKADAEVLHGCDEDQLKRMLESRRSDRSVAKRKGLRTSAVNCRAYISAMYAELMIREKLGMSYSGTTTASDLDEADTDAVERKIRSLQSKQSRLRKLAAYDADAKAELTGVQDEISRLQGLRPDKVVAKSALKDVSVTELRKALDTVDINSLPEAEQEKIRSMIELLAR